MDSCKYERHGEFRNYLAYLSLMKDGDTVSVLLLKVVIDLFLSWERRPSSR